MRLLRNGEVDVMRQCYGKSFKWLFFSQFKKGAYPRRVKSKSDIMNKVLN